MSRSSRTKQIIKLSLDGHIPQPFSHTIQTNLTDNDKPMELKPEIEGQSGTRKRSRSSSSSSSSSSTCFSSSSSSSTSTSTCSNGTSQDVLPQNTSDTFVDSLRRAADRDYNALGMKIPIAIDASDTVQSNKQNCIEYDNDITNCDNTTRTPTTSIDLMRRTTECHFSFTDIMPAFNDACNNSQSDKHNTNEDNITCDNNACSPSLLNNVDNLNAICSQILRHLRT